MKRKMVSLFPLLIFAGCYGAAPPRPTAIPLPPLEPTAKLEVNSEPRIVMEDVERQAKTCDQRDSSNCVVSKYREQVAVTHTISKVSYNGKPIQYRQFLVLSNPHYDQQVVELTEHAQACQKANVPRWIGAALSIAGGATLLFVRTDNAAVNISGMAALGGGVTSYALGYFSFGGRRCNQARALHNQLEVANLTDYEIDGAYEAKELQEKADAFNQRDAVQNDFSEKTTPASHIPPPVPKEGRR